MNKLNQVVAEMAQWAEGPYLLAVSGGPDSMCLAHLFSLTKHRFALAHVNYGLRNEASDADEALVRAWANENNCPVFVEQPTTKAYQQAHGLSLQEAARDIRYDFFHRLQTETDYKVLVTAHQRNDQDETMLLNLFRGTGLRGLRGIPSGEINGIRPLLAIDRSEIMAWLNEYQVPYRIDESNHSNQYTRNAIRNEVIPLLKKHFPQLEMVLADNRRRFQSSYTVMQREITRWQLACTEWRAPNRHFFIRTFIKDPEAPLYLYETLRDYGFYYRQMQEIMLLAQRNSGAYVESATHRMIKHRETFILCTKQTTAADWVPCFEQDTLVETPAGNWTITRRPYKGEPIPTSGDAFWFDAAAFEYPLWFRPKKNGDYFYPLGLGKKKKISRLLIDAKMAIPDKEQIWVLQSGERLAWVIGMRQDDRFKVTSQTREVLIFTAKNP